MIKTNSRKKISIGNIRRVAELAITPIKRADKNTYFEEDFHFKCGRTEAGRDLPLYYLVYFLLAKLLKYDDLGRIEKVAWAIPIDFKGKGYTIEHRKFGIGVFAYNPSNEESQAKQIVHLIKKGTRAAEPYFSCLAEQAAGTFKINVSNNCPWLFARYQFFKSQFRNTLKKAKRSLKSKDAKALDKIIGTTKYSIGFPQFKLRRHASWLGLATIEAFFSWTEHLFVHLAILGGKIRNGIDVADLADKDWGSKYKVVFDLTQKEDKNYFDRLLEFRRQYRNFVAHGAFGKNGEAFEFHSKAGAVPIILIEKPRNHRFALDSGLDFDPTSIIKFFDQFLRFIWAGPRKPARAYLMDSLLPLILTMANDGTYAEAMTGVNKMNELIKHLSYEFDRGINMDW